MGSSSSAAKANRALEPRQQRCSARDGSWKLVEVEILEEQQL
jgi:hypothetical protein